MLVWVGFAYDPSGRRSADSQLTVIDDGPDDQSVWTETYFRSGLPRRSKTTLPSLIANSV